MEMGSELHAPAALHPVEKLPVHIESEAGWPQRRSRCFGEEKKARQFLTSCLNIGRTTRDAGNIRL
jgi:hypothetical protein